MSHHSNTERKMKKQCLVAALISALVLISSPATSQDRGVREPQKPKAAALGDKAARHALIYKIVREWGPYVNQIYREDIRLWADRMVPTFRQADTSKLRAAAAADTFEAMNNALLGQKGVSQVGLPGGVAPKLLGSATSDLVYTALPGCILVDTRKPGAGGIFAAASTRNYKASGPNFTAQGGSNTNCGIPTAPVSLVLNVAAISPAGSGYFRMWPYGTAIPAAANISYQAGQNIQNDMILKMSQGLVNDFSVYSSSSSQLVVTVLGYFSAPVATELECQTVTASVDVVAEGFATIAATCPGNLLLQAPWALTGGGCHNSFSVETNTSQSYPSETRSWTCGMRNNGATPHTLSAYARCCRTPGREPGVIFIPL